MERNLVSYYVSQFESREECLDEIEKLTGVRYRNSRLNEFIKKDRYPSRVVLAVMMKSCLNDILLDTKVIERPLPPHIVNKITQIIFAGEENVES